MCLFFLIVQTEETRNVSHWQFTSWPDYGVPASAMAMLNFLQRVREQQAKMVKALGDTWAGHPRGPPIVVHCSAGIGRTGKLKPLSRIFPGHITQLKKNHFQALLSLWTFAYRAWRT